MAYSDEQSYEEMISILQNYIAQVEEQCGVMEKAGEDCVDNTDNDPAAEQSNAKLQQCVSQIRSSEEAIQEVIVGLQQEMEEIREAAAKASYSD